jgi:hypothetical protein
MMIETSPPDLQRQRLIPPRSAYEPDKDEQGSIQALAKGVLRQAAKDLRAFHDAHEATGRELYRDAYSWVNVCEALGLSAEFVRSELLTDARSGWYSHSRLVARRISTSFKGSLTNFFRRGDLKPTQERLYAMEFPQLKSASPASPMRLRNS